MTITEASIMHLDEIVADLRPEHRSLFDRIFGIAVTVGRLMPPESMEAWIKTQFGTLPPVLEQRIIRVTNLVTLEGVMFNWLRSNRPIWKTPGVDLDEELARNTGDPLREPLSMTPEDIFGRVHGEFSLTASNVAKFDAFHGLVIFDEENPLQWDRDQIHDYLETGRRWAERAHELEPEARYYLFIWNCLWRAGASLLHGHAQVLLGQGMHYAAVERLRRNALLYQAHTRSNYFSDLFEAHRLVGCGFERSGVKVFANLAPIKENEVILMSDQDSVELRDTIYDVLKTLRDRVGVQSFNMVIFSAPFPDGELRENWQGFPVMVRIVDRGDPQSRTADFAAMELYAASVVSSDPLHLAALLQDSLL